MKSALAASLLSCCWILTSCTGTAEKTGAYEEQGSFEKTEFQASSGRVISYLMMEPAEMNSGEQYPLVLALHGIGGRGQEDWEKNCYANAVLAKPAMREKHPCFVIAPSGPSKP
jgi:predicted peptidase